MTHRRQPPRDYPPGYFSAPVTDGAGWPPRFIPALTTLSDLDIKRRAAAQAGREKAQAEGTGWGDGTIAALRTGRAGGDAAA